MRKINFSGGYVVGFILLVVALGLFFWWQQDESESAAPAVGVGTATAVSTSSPPALSSLSTDAMLICTDAAGINLWHYNATQQAWQMQSARFLRSPGFIPQGMIPLPGNEAILAYGVTVAEDNTARFQAYVWQDGSEQLVIDADRHYTLVTLASGFPQARDHLYAVSVDDPSDLVRLDVDQCLNGSCQLAPVDRLVLHAPQGERVIEWQAQVQVEAFNQLHVSDVFTDTGWSPFWLDEDTVGYLHPVDDLVLRPVEALAETIRLLDREQARALLVTQDVIAETTPLFLTNAKGTPAHSNVVLVSAMEPEKLERAYLFVVERQTGQVHYIPEIKSPMLSELALSPGGDFLIVPGDNELQLYALATGEIVTYRRPLVTDGVRGYAFTPNGQWLLLPAGVTTYLAQPGSGQMEEVSLAGQHCTIGTWLDASSTASLLSGN